MITTNILDGLGNIIGSLSFPDGTDTATINAALSLYSNPISIDKIPVLPSYSLAATSPITTSSSSPSILDGMSITPPAGTYIAFFSGSISTAGASATGQFAIYVNNVILGETQRPISCNLSLLGGLVSISLNTIGVGTYTGTKIVVDGTQSIDVRYKSTNGGTIGFAERTFMLMKVI